MAHSIFMKKMFSIYDRDKYTLKCIRDVVSAHAKNLTNTEETQVVITLKKRKLEYFASRKISDSHNARYNT